MITQRIETPRATGSRARRAWDTELLVLRGEDRAALLELTRAAADYLRRHPETDLADLAFTLNADLPPGGCRLAVVAATASAAAAGLERAAARLADPRCEEVRDAAGLYFTARPLHPEGKVAFLFPGEGAQFPGMLADVSRAFPEVLAFFAECDGMAARVGDGRSLTGAFLLPEGSGEEDRARAEQELRRLDTAMMSVLMADWALYQLLGRFGLAPDVLAGHSMGELAALWAAGALETGEDFLAPVHEAMTVMRRQEEEAGADTVLLAVGVGRAALAELLGGLGGPPVHVAMDNCPHQAVVVGPAGPMAAVEAELQRRHLVCERLPFRRPYHTPLFAPLLEPLRQLFATVRFRPPRTPVYSCTTARPFPDDPDAVRALALAHWAEPVRFTELIENLYAAGVRLFVESGPRGNLSAFVEDILRGRPFAALPANVPRRSGVTQVHHLLGRLAAHNVPLRLAPLYERHSPRRLDWPPHATRVRRAAPAPADLRGRVLTQYLGVMERFLDVQKEMTELFLRGRRPARPARRETPPPPASAHPPARPLLGEVVRHVPGRELVVRRALDLGEDLFAAHHTVGGREISKFDPQHYGLPVLPMTFTLEMMAEAAAVLAPGKVVTAVRDVRLYRWLAFDEEEPTAVELTARVAESPGGQVRVEAEVRDLGRPGGAKTGAGLAAQAAIVLDDAYPPAPPPAPFPMTNPRPASLSVAQTYRNLFHGPLFQGVRSNDRVGDEAIESRVEVLSRHELFRSVPRPDFLFDPVLLDVTMHPLAAWHLEQPDQAGRILLPVGVDSFDFFGPPPAPGTPLTVRGRVARADGRAFVHDGDASAGGSVLIRLGGVKCWRFYVPFGQVNFHGPKDEYFLSERWARAEGQAPAGPRPAGPFALIRLEPPADVRQSAMLQVTAKVTLTPREMREFRRRSRDGEEVRDWLFDRIAAKDVVRHVWHGQTGVRLFPADIAVTPGPGGVYQARGRGESGPAYPPAAVDRADGLTAAVAAAGSDRVGIALAIAGDADGDEAALRLRCACRAVAQAAGLGPDQVGIPAADAGSGTVTVAVPRPDGGEEHWRAYTARDGAVVVAWTLGERGPA